jgi:hypothetical protein
MENISRDCCVVVASGNEGNSYRCGLHCVFDKTITTDNKCWSSCSDHYYNNLGIYILNNNCESRNISVNDDGKLTCGEKYYKYSDNCVSVCPSEYHDVDANGICTHVIYEDNNIRIDVDKCKYVVYMIDRMMNAIEIVKTQIIMKCDN